jgi:hypothetical protein
MSEAEKIRRLMAVAARVVRTGRPISAAHMSVDEYVIPADAYLQLYEAVEDVLKEGNNGSDGNGSAE